MASSRVLNIPELLTEIFHVCLPESGLPQYSPREAPVSVSQVNKRWRAIALTIRRLWSRLSLRHEFKKSTGSSTGIPEANDTFSVLSLLTEWLERSNPVPFSLILKFRWSEGSYSTDLWVTHVGEFFSENSCRWELLDTNIHPFVMRNAYKDKEFTQLKKLRLHKPLWSGVFEYCDYRTPRTYYYIEKNPKLEYLQLHGDFSTHGRFFVSGIPPGLKEIILHEMYLPRLHRGQPSPTSIINLIFSNVIFFWQGFQKFPDFFPLLKRFEITSDESELLGWQRPDHFVVLKNLREVVMHGNEYCFPMMYSSEKLITSMRKRLPDTRHFGILRHTLLY